jgi:hypothetical protein
MKVGMNSCNLKGLLHMLLTSFIVRTAFPLIHLHCYIAIMFTVSFILFPLPGRS